LLLYPIIALELLALLHEIQLATQLYVFSLLLKLILKKALENAISCCHKPSQTVSQVHMSGSNNSI